MTLAQFRAAALIVMSATAGTFSSLMAQGVPAWRLVPEVRIGAEQALTNVLQIMTLPDSVVLVADDKNKQIYVFTQNGSYSHSIGRNGRGPGEFERLQSVGMLGDTLWVIDSRERRTSLFDVNGTFLTSIRNDTGAWITAIVPNGAVGSATSPLGSPTMGREQRLPALLMTRGGQTVDTLVWVPSQHWTLVLGPASDGSYIIGDQPFSDAGMTIVEPSSGLLFVVDRSVTATSRRAQFSVLALRSTGDTLWSRSYSYTPRPLEKARGDSLLALRQPRMLRAGYSRSDVREALFIPDYYPPVSSGIATSDGSLWLKTQVGEAAGHYWIIDAKGELVAIVAVPEGVIIKHATAAEAWGVMMDEYNVPIVTRYRIERSFQ